MLDTDENMEFCNNFSIDKKFYTHFRISDHKSSHGTIFIFIISKMINLVNAHLQYII